MKFVVQLLLFFTLLLTFQNTSAQETIKTKIKQEAEKMTKAFLDGDYELFLEYNHPNLIKFSGGKQKMIDILEKQMATMANDGFIINSVEIDEPTDLKLHKGQYQTVVPKKTIMTSNGQKILSKDYLFGFSDSKGKKWTFVEAAKLKSATAKRIFPDFETAIEIPEKEVPIVIGEDGSVDLLILEDENAGTYDTPYESGKKWGYLFGIVFSILFFIGLLIGLVFLFIYFNKKKKTPVVRDVTPKPTVKKTLKITCAECEAENNSDSKYCTFCGYALPH